MAGWIEIALGMEVGLSPGQILLDGNPAPLPKKGGIAPFNSSSMSCGQTAEWIKMAVGMEVGLGPGDIVLDGNPAPPEKSHSPHLIFSPYLLWPNSWMDEDAATVADLSYC